jgi:dihydroorotate dehydrogenase (fumarate)
MWDLRAYHEPENNSRTAAEQCEYDSVKQLKGSLSQRNCDDPGSYERAQFMRAISTFVATLGPVWASLA